MNSSRNLELATCVEAQLHRKKSFVHLNKCLYRQHKNLVLFRCEVKVAKPEPSLVDLTLLWVGERRLSLSTV